MVALPGGPGHLDEFAKREVTQKDRPRGLVMQSDTRSLTFPAANSPTIELNQNEPLGNGAIFFTPARFQYASKIPRWGWAQNTKPL